MNHIEGDRALKASGGDRLGFQSVARRVAAAWLSKLAAPEDEGRAERLLWPPLQQDGADLSDLVWLLLIKGGNPDLYRWI
jgi:hypothetical protein